MVQIHAEVATETMMNPDFYFGERRLDLPRRAMLSPVRLPGGCLLYWLVPPPLDEVERRTADETMSRAMVAGSPHDEPDEEVSP